MLRKSGVPADCPHSQTFSLGNQNLCCSQAIAFGPEQRGKGEKKFILLAWGGGSVFGGDHQGSTLDQGPSGMSPLQGCHAQPPPVEEGTALTLSGACPPHPRGTWRFQTPRAIPSKQEGDGPRLSVATSQATCKVFLHLSARSDVAPAL